MKQHFCVAVLIMWGLAQVAGAQTRPATPVAGKPGATSSPEVPAADPPDISVAGPISA